MRTNNRCNIRKRSHTYVSMSRIKRVTAMPRFGTRAYAQRAKNGLPASFDVDYTAKESKYLKSLGDARYDAGSIQYKFPSGEVYLLEKVNKTSRRINLV